jgi:hypothetical protein
MIRARMEELRRERAGPRAADDFAMIRRRMEELRRERAQALAEVRGRSVIHPRPLIGPVMLASPRPLTSQNPEFTDSPGEEEGFEPSVPRRAGKRQGGSPRARLSMRLAPAK